jgi:facilitated trehalose transporter
LGSAAVTSISLAAMGVFFYFQRIWGEADATLHLGWLPLVSLMVFMAAYSCGLSNVPFIVMGELFPTRYRTFLGTISSSFNLIVTLIVVRFFPDMLTGLGKDVTFFVFTGCTLTCIVFVYFLLPETKGKTLEDMEQLFSNNVPKVKKIPEEEDEEAVPEVSTQLVTISNGQCGLVGHNIVPTTEEIENDEVFATF